MKIHNNQPISGKSTRKTARSRSDGVFGKLLESEIAQVPAIHESSEEAAQSSMQQAWQDLEGSISLLNQARQRLENGSNPSPQLILEIEQLRSSLHRQVDSGCSSVELRQVDTLLAVEAERIRSMRD